MAIRGVDPHFGLSRSYYYDLDKAGQVLLVRLRRRGTQKGVVLVNYEAMSAFLAKAGKSAINNNPEGAIPPPSAAPALAAGNVHRLVQRHPEDTELIRKLTPALLHDPEKRAKLSVHAGRIFARAGVEGKSFHCLRHSFVTRLSKSGKSLEEIGKIVGHSSTETTKGYAH